MAPIEHPMQTRHRANRRPSVAPRSRTVTSRISKRNSTHAARKAEAEARAEASILHLLNDPTDHAWLPSEIKHEIAGRAIQKAVLKMYEGKSQALGCLDSATSDFRNTIANVETLFKTSLLGGTEIKAALLRQKLRVRDAFRDCLLCVSACDCLTFSEAWNAKQEDIYYKYMMRHFRRHDILGDRILSLRNARSEINTALRTMKSVQC